MFTSISRLSSFLVGYSDWSDAVVGLRQLVMEGWWFYEEMVMCSREVHGGEDEEEKNKHRIG